MLKQIRIKSDGSGLDTVVTTESGEELECCSVTLWLEAKEINKADITFIGPKVNVMTDVDTVTLACPLCDYSDTHKCEER